MKGKCRLCLNENVELQNSHIIPEFMYQKLYNDKPKRYYTIRINDKSRSKRIEQKGIREKLLCKDCELKLSKLENYASETIYAKNYQNKAILKKANQDPNQRIFLYEFEKFDYTMFKLFLMSLLWRLSVSSKFDTISIGIHEEQLRKAILSDNPLAFYEYGCLVQTILYEKGKLASGFILNPFSTKMHGVKFIHILIDSFMYSYPITDSNDLPAVSENFLKEDGTMNIVGRLLWDDKDLLSKVYQAYEYYNNNIEKINLKI